MGHRIEYLPIHDDLPHKSPIATGSGLPATLAPPRRKRRSRVCVSAMTYYRRSRRKLRKSIGTDMRRGLLSLLLPLAAIPGGWPHHLALGLTDPPGDAKALVAHAPLDMRYQYLTGGANTGGGWATWN